MCVRDIFGICIIPHVDGIRMVTSDYKSISVPSKLVAEVDKWVGRHGYRSRAEIVVDATRHLVEELRWRRRLERRSRKDTR